MRLRSFITILLVLIVSGSLVGCESEEPFYLMSQSEKQEYVNRELNNLYGIDCEISEIVKSQNKVFEDERYIGTAFVSKNRQFSFSVDVEGNVVDTYSYYKMSYDIEDYISDIVSNYYKEGDYSVYCTLGLDTSLSKPVKELTVEGILQDDNIESNLYLFLGSETENDVSNIQCILSDLDGYNGRLKVYYCENPTKVDFDTYNISISSYYYTFG